MQTATTDVFSQAFLLEAQKHLPPGINVSLDKMPNKRAVFRLIGVGKINPNTQHGLNPRRRRIATTYAMKDIASGATLQIGLVKGQKALPGTSGNVVNTHEQIAFTPASMHSITLDASNPRDQKLYHVLLFHPQNTISKGKPWTEQPGKAEFEIELPELQAKSTRNTLRERGVAQGKIDLMSHAKRQELCRGLGMNPYGSEDEVYVRLIERADRDSKGVLHAMDDHLVATKAIIRESKDLGILSEHNGTWSYGDRYGARSIMISPAGLDPVEQFAAYLTTNEEGRKELDWVVAEVERQRSPQKTSEPTPVPQVENTDIAAVMQRLAEVEANNKALQARLDAKPATEKPKRGRPPKSKEVEA